MEINRTASWVFHGDNASFRRGNLLDGHRYYWRMRKHLSHRRNGTGLLNPLYLSRSCEVSLDSWVALISNRLLFIPANQYHSIYHSIHCASLSIFRGCEIHTPESLVKQSGSVQGWPEQSVNWWKHQSLQETKKYARLVFDKDAIIFGDKISGWIDFLLLRQKDMYLDTFPRPSGASWQTRETWKSSFD